MKRRRFLVASATAAGSLIAGWPGYRAFGATKKIVYITPGMDLPFWRAIAAGVGNEVQSAGFLYQVLDSRNSAQTQLQNAQDSIAREVSGIVLSPTDSSTAPSVLALARRASIPVVICDIGANGGEYVCFVKSDNYKGAFGVGQVLAERLKEKGWQSDPYGLCTISLARKNGQDRTAGFRDAMKTAGVTHEAALKQMESYTTDETFKFVQDMLTATPNLRGLFVEVDQSTLGALQAIKAARKQNQLLVVSFDGLPEFVSMLKTGELIAVGMQQPLLMGGTAAKCLIDSLNGKVSQKEVLIPIIVATHENIDSLLPTLQKTVFLQKV